MKPQGPGDERDPSSPGPDGAGGPGPDDDLGSVAEEALKLFGALTDLARSHDLGASAASAAGHAASAAANSAAGAARAAGDAAHHAGERVRHIDEHIATGAPECTYCPVCRGIDFVRETSPEVRAHLASAAASLMQAAAGLLASAAVDPQASDRSEKVERIDLDDEPDGPTPPPADATTGSTTGSTDHPADHPADQPTEPH